MSAQRTTLTRPDYDQLTPARQGYTSYMQGEWNTEIPRDCPYPPGSEAREDWDHGNFSAMIEVQDYG